MLGLGLYFAILQSQVCVYEDYLLSSPPGWRILEENRQIKAWWEIFFGCYQPSQSCRPLTDCLWRSRRWGEGQFTTGSWNIETFSCAISDADPSKSLPHILEVINKKSIFPSFALIFCLRLMLVRDLLLSSWPKVLGQPYFSLLHIWGSVL